MKSDIRVADKLDIIKNISYFWAAKLTPQETVIVHWLVANTIGRGNLEGRYSLNQFVTGIRHRTSFEEEWWCHGVGMSKNTVRRALATLFEKGVIEIGGTNKFGTKYSVNLEWTPPM